MTETITTAAILSNGRVWTLPRPARHHNVLAEMRRQGHALTAFDEQGFLTSDGRFLGRIEAAGLAVASGQVDQEGLAAFPNLFSEDLW